MARGSDTPSTRAKSGKQPAKKSRFAWIGQLKQTYDIAKREDPYIGWILLAIFLVTFAVFVVVALLIPVGTVTKVLIIVLGFSAALLLTTFIFGRRAERAAYASISGQQGAAAAVLSSLRGGWFTTPGVAVTKNEDLVHVTVGRPGIILVGEGSPSRLKHLLANQHKKFERWVPEVPITEIMVGDGDGQIPLAKLQKHVQKMPKALRPAEVTEVRNRVESATKAANPVSIPKGPMPKNSRMQRPKGM